jgi:hypothetical protein
MVRNLELVQLALRVLVLQVRQVRQVPQVALDQQEVPVQQVLQV